MTLVESNTLSSRMVHLLTRHKKKCLFVVLGVILVVSVGVSVLLSLCVIAPVLLIAFLLRPYPSHPSISPTRRFAPLHASAFDFIVVGAGSAGCVLAASLAQLRPNASILLVESGRDMHQEPEATSQLHNWMGFLMHWAFDYDLSTIPNHALNDRQLQYCRGHGTGGCSTVNAMMWVAGHQADYDDWEKVAGAEGWGWKNLRGLFSGLEAYGKGNDNRGKEGPFEIQEVGTASPQHRAFLHAAVQANVGMAKKSDYNDGDNEGIGFCQQNITKDNRRQDAFTCMIEPLLIKHKNLHVIDHARVQRVVLDEPTDGSEPRAIGIIVDRPGSGAVFIGATKEVVLSAGAVHTPQILMLSGIGPKEHLNEHDIRCRVASAGVGSNAQDHPALSCAVVLKDPIDRALVERDGSGLNVTGFYTSSWAKKNEPKRGPDMQMVGVGTPQFFDVVAPLLLTSKLMAYRAHNTLSGRLFRNTVRFVRDAFVKTGVLSDSTAKLYSVGVVLNHPASRGSVRLASADPKDAPLIDLNMLSEPQDLDRLVEAVQKAVIVLKQKEFAELVDKPTPDFAAVYNSNGRDVEAVTALLRAQTSHAWHICGTCAMGDTTTSVVDPQLRVRGVRGLRVADASVMPTLPSGNTNVPSLLVGAKGAHLIAADH